MTVKDHISVLADLFARAQLGLSIPSHDASSSAAYYDQTLQTKISLRVPITADLPSPPPDSPLHASALTLPLPAPDGYDSHDLVPALLSTLLFCLHVGLSADYVPPPHPQLPSQPQHSNPFTPIPTVTKVQPAYQNLPSSSADTTTASTQQFGQVQPISCYSNAWAGNKVSEKKEAAAPFAAMQASAIVAFDGHDWVVEWLADVPVVFVSTPFPPMLSLTASLTLQLSHRLLDSLLTEPHGLSSSASAFSHSLLSPLHEGPIYPDESTSERLARARNSSSLGLDGPNSLGNHLAQLGKQILGSDHSLVTPRSGLEGLSEVEKRRKKMLEDAIAVVSPSDRPDKQDDGDLGGISSTTSTRASLETVRPGHDQPDATSAPLQILKRSTRHVLQVKSGLSVRMRTLFTSYSPFPPVEFGDTEDTDESALVLCVKLDNPVQSGLDFDVEKVDIKVDEKSLSSSTPRIKVQLLDSTFPVRLNQGQQRNLLYYLRPEVTCASSDEPLTTSFRLSALLSSGKRNVAIVVTGRPVSDSTELFDSKWNCSLDLSALFNNIKKKENVAGGRVEQSVTSLPPTAGSVRHSAISLDQAYQADVAKQRVGSFMGRSLSFGPTPSTPVRQEMARMGSTGTIPPLGRGVPPRGSSVTAAPLTPRTPSSGRLATPQAPGFSRSPSGGLLTQAKQRAANAALERSILETIPHSQDSDVASIKRSSLPLTLDSAPRLRPWSNATPDLGSGLVISTSLRPRTAARDEPVGKGMVFTSTSGQVGGSIATVLHPTRIENGHFVCGDVAELEVFVLNRHEEIPIILSWAEDVPEELQTTTRLTDAEGAKKRHLSALKHKPSLVPLENDIMIHTRYSTSSIATLGLVCLSPGLHPIPDILFQAQGSVLRLTDIGSIYVSQS